MSTITIETEALATLVQELAAEDLGGVGTIFLSGRAHGISSLHRKLLQHARPAPSLVNHDDVIGPTAWRHRLPHGQTFLGGRVTQVLESLQDALRQLDRFGGSLQPLFELSSAGDTDTWKNEGGQS